MLMVKIEQTDKQMRANHQTLLRVLKGESSLRSDFIYKIKVINTQNINNITIGNLNIKSLFSNYDDLKVFVTGVFEGSKGNKGSKTGLHISSFRVS